MMLKRLIPAVACAALLAACASTGEGAGGAAKATTVAAAVAEADAAVAAGQADKAFALLKGAAQAFPTDKTPWLRMAQMRFDANDYGEAIVNAQEALERDPDDTLAHSIAAVSGLRVSSEALADLSRMNKINSDVKSEAQDLAKLLRASLGEEVLVPGAVKPKGTVKRAARGSSAAPAAKTTASSSSDPFGALK
ncbi:MAG: tetratricopeptide repeat protein [Pseudomonadota bacterium]